MNYKHKFSFLHEWLGPSIVHEKIAVRDIVDDSKRVVEGDVFIDLAFSSEISEKNMKQAIDRKAVAIVTSRDRKHIQTNVPIIVIPELREHIAQLAAEFYDNPSVKMQLVAITGTNGKTTTALLMMQAIQAMGTSSGYIGTLGYGCSIDSFVSTGLTTPSALQLQKILHHMYVSGVQVVIVEVSSHALVQNRVAHCCFDVGIFTNLSRDHLDYHQSMFDYAQAKKSLFTKHKVFNIIMNVDDEVGKQFEQELSQAVIPFTFNAIVTKNPAIHMHLDYCDKRGNAISTDCVWGKGSLHSRLMGQFNAYNLASAWLGLVVLGYPFDQSASVLSLIEGIPGRFETYRPSQLKPTVVIDYAHTPSALEVVLQAVRALTHHHVWVVFGCGGNRDRGKRAMMGQVAERLADRVVLTNDNPRDEDPEVIIADVLKGMICPWAVEIEMDRAIAIKRAIMEAKAGDIVLIAGKGHEKTQKLKNTTMPFEDKTHVLNALGVEDI